MIRWTVAALLLCICAHAQWPSRVTVEKYLVPKYPAIARSAQITGEVKFHLFLNGDGTIREAKVVSGHPMLLKSAQDALKGWKFWCAECKGRPFEHELTIGFHLGPECDDYRVWSMTYSFPNELDVTACRPIVEEYDTVIKPKRRH